MNKQQMIDRINELAKKFNGCDGVYGIKGWNKPRLAAMLAEYERMGELNQKCLTLLADNCATQYDTIKYSLMGDNAPGWYKAYWLYKMQAIEIWRKNF